MVPLKKGSKKHLWYFRIVIDWAYKRQWIVVDEDHNPREDVERHSLKCAIKFASSKTSWRRTLDGGVTISKLYGPLSTEEECAKKAEEILEETIHAR